LENSLNEEGCMKSEERQLSFEQLVARWQGLEDKTLHSASDIADKATNPFIRTVMQMIKLDSQKHRIVLQSILDSENTEIPHISRDELKSVASMLDAHMELEAESIDLALAADTFKGNRLFATRFLLSTLLEDEMKHHRMTAELLDCLKLESIAGGQNDFFFSSSQRQVHSP
jgi:hypothetical protein